jgi:hypothetical protein
VSDNVRDLIRSAIADHEARMHKTSEACPDDEDDVLVFPPNVTRTVKMVPAAMADRLREELAAAQAELKATLIAVSPAAGLLVDDPWGHIVERYRELQTQLKDVRYDLDAASSLACEVCPKIGCKEATHYICDEHFADQTKAETPRPVAGPLTDLVAFAYECAALTCRNHGGDVSVDPDHVDELLIARKQLAAAQAELERLRATQAELEALWVHVSEMTFTDAHDPPVRLAIITRRRAHIQADWAWELERYDATRKHRDAAPYNLAGAIAMAREWCENPAPASDAREEKEGPE